ncbi:unnamed protein product [Rotaria magnacalcarata]
MKDLVSRDLLIYIKINVLGPPVIILKVNDIKNSTNLSSKPPPALATNTNSIDENNASLLCTPKISMSQQATAVSTSTSIQFNQPISVRLLNKCTNKLTVGSIRSLKIVPQ